MAIEIEPLSVPLRVSALSGEALPKITHRTKPVRLVISGNHSELISFFVFRSASPSIVLGFDWLQEHNPHINWTESHIEAWSRKCHTTCLRAAVPPSQGTAKLQEADPLDLSAVPAEYHDLAAVFSKDKALSLPPHRPYDCAIDLLSGAPLPNSRLYNISRPERQTMEKYINDSLAAGIIRTSSSPLAAGFFFVGKKDGSLRPCIDYRGLNQITVKNKYPLPLLSSAFEPVHGATIFTKLDLRNAYHLLRIREGDEWKTAFKTPMGHYEYLVMPFGLSNAPAFFQALINDVLRDFINSFVFVYLDDILIYSKSPEEHSKHVRQVLQRLLENKLFVKAEKCEFHRQSVNFLGYILEGGQVRPSEEKIRAVLDWPRPETRKQLQRFLGFANFYRRFIRNYSQTASPLTALTSTKSAFTWTPQADAAFQQLKSLFANAPILVQPDPSRQFILEVDASDSGVGAVLSQVSNKDNRSHPCAFFSRRLTPPERNYDVGDRELLAIKLALEEWRHWLEGAEHPIVVWTDHKNLAYLQSAKRSNPRRSRWSLFFSRFNLSISYRPGSKNIKPDALSRIYAPDDSNEGPAPVLPSSCTVGVVSWEIEDVIRQAHQAEPPPPSCPDGKIFVAASVRSRFLQWVHSSKFSGHPGISRTIALVNRRFWWPSIHKDVREFVLACSVCSRNKSSHQPPAGLLQPLPTPKRPWSHIAVDFVTGLPTSKGMTAILTVIDRFSKSCHLIPLRKLPTSSQTAHLLIKHVFRLHGIPMEILSDRGPQFVSQVWRQFCTALGAKVALSSGYHPQTNGQTERMNQELEATLRCLTASNPADWSQYLPWAEYAHNSHVSAATGLSPFEVSLGYQPPLLPSDEEMISVTSAQHHIRRCQKVWRDTIAALNNTAAQNKRIADRKRAPAPSYAVG
uniref:Gypsy retrotransposon integrase-like protein 1 n=1 Tax=Poecilia formosa TaxID=48698 RepID=A0A096M8A1_POEFO